jgi:hypothetical protein
MRYWFHIIFGMLAAFSIPALGQTRGREAFEAMIRPLLREYCHECHAEGADEGGFDLDAFADYPALVADFTTWDQAAQLLASHVMPPAGEPQPSREQRRALLDWIDNVVFYADPDNPDPGPVVVRRLSRAEYDRTIRDLFGLDTRPAEGFPPDDSAHGFDHIGGTVSPLFLEKHLRAARESVEEVTRPVSVQQAGELIRGKQFAFYSGNPEVFEEMVLLKIADDTVGFDVTLPVPALYRIQLRAASTKTANGAFATFEVQDNGKPVTTFTPTHVYNGKRQYWDANLALVEFAAGRHRISVRVTDPPVAGRVAAVHTLAVQGPYAPVAPMAGHYLRELIGRDVPLGLPSLRLSGEDFEMGEGKSSLDTGAAWFGTRGFRFTGFALKSPGRYRFRVKAGAQQADDELVRFEVALGDRGLGPQTVTAGAQQAQWIEFEADAPAGEHQLRVHFLNELLGEDGKSRRLFWLHELEIQGPLDAKSGLSREETVEALAKAGRRVFRRPLTDSETKKLAAFANAGSDSESLAPFRSGLEWLLSSPHFLFLGTSTQPAGEAHHGSVAIDEFSLAARLSYFLWSSTPDEPLLELAGKGRLRADLAGQVKRMLADPRAHALTEQFAGQWLQLRDLSTLAPDPKQFPDFDPVLTADMREETERLFEHLLRVNRPIHELLTADYTFANDRLAAHYGIAGTGGDFQRVPLAGTPRRGILGHAGILALTSHPTRTSPVNRGKFVLDKILGTPPPPAPGNVPPLEQTKTAAGAGLRAQLEAHRKNKQCAACHAFLDPMGLALENFDAIGRWRDEEEGHRIDPGGQLVTGERFSGFADLRALLAGPLRGQFLENVTEQLLTYALGRGLLFTDKVAVREILAKAKKDDYRMQSLIIAVCESVPFQRMRAE